jgi:hypothetical protein
MTHHTMRGAVDVVDPKSDNPATTATCRSNPIGPTVPHTAAVETLEGDQGINWYLSPISG